MFHSNPPSPIVLLPLLLLALAACGTSPGTGEPQSDAESDVIISDVSDVRDADTEDAVDTADPPNDTDPPDGAREPDVEVGPDAIPPRDVSPERDVPGDELEEACVAACESREEPNAGGCPVSLERECADWCVDIAPDVQPELLDAYFECLSQDPLCFQTMLQCAIGLTYPDPFLHTLTLRGSGYDAWEGARVVAAVEESAGVFLPAVGVVQEGAFELTFEVVMHLSQSHLTLFYIDSNENGACDADADETGSGSIELWALPENQVVLPEWLIEVSPDPDTNMGFVCGYLE